MLFIPLRLFVLKKGEASETETYGALSYKRAGVRRATVILSIDSRWRCPSYLLPAVPSALEDGALRSITTHNWKLTTYWLAWSSPELQGMSGVSVSQRF